jgi:acetyl esterase/lipase
LRRALGDDTRLRRVWGNAQAYSFDPHRIAAWGGSAGGHLAAMLGVSAGVPDLEALSLGDPKQSSHVQALVDWYGPTNFLKMDECLEANGRLPQEGPHSPCSPTCSGV